ncbi:MAG: nucleotide sugar dehydrogenase [Amphritea sp.]|nr:nucleotide sugar dehydrogenase [Amphritea sp.]
MDGKDYKIAVIGLGYVGLPLAVEFGQQYDTLGYDISSARLAELKAGHDITQEVSESELQSAHHLKFTGSLSDLQAANIYIVTVPTPIDANKQPDLTPLLSASKAVGEVLSPGDTVIYESTVYPGTTEEDCVPVLEQVSGLSFNIDFFVGYSPERINPGDKERRLRDILKITSGSTPEIAEQVDRLYSSIITAGTYRAESIKVAEAAKIIENTQRDMNIAVVNEFALIFHKLGIDTDQVLKAAGTKWNFLPFRPGLVGGHCIGVDPYYLAHKAKSVGYQPDVIMSGRIINDGMAAHVGSSMIKAMLHQQINLVGARILIMGLAFKENCPDFRNTKVVDLIQVLQGYGVTVDICDSWVDQQAVEAELGLTLIEQPEHGTYDGILLAVPHQDYIELGAPGVRRFGKSEHFFYDLKSVFNKNESDMRL